MSTRVARAPGGHPGPTQTGRGAATARKRSTDTAGKPGRRVSEEHHDHEATCPMNAGKKGASAPSVGSAHGRVKSARSPGPQAAPSVGSGHDRVKSARSPGPQAAPGSRRAASAPAKAAPVRGASVAGKQPAKRSSTADNRTEWNTSPPVKPRVSSGKPSKPTTTDQSPARRNPPTKKPVSRKLAPVGKSGIPKRKSTGLSAPTNNKPGNADAAKNVEKGSVNDRPEKARPAASSKSVENGIESGEENQKDQLSVPDDRPRSDSTTGAGKSELGKFLEKLHLEEMYGSSDEESDDAKVTEPVKFTNTWRTGDGDDDKMNALRTKPRTNEPSISPSWNFEDLIIAKKPEKDDRRDSPKQKNRYSFLVDSSDNDEPDANSTNKTNAEDFSRFDGFLRESLSPDQNGTNGSLSRKKPEPVSEKVVRPSTAAQSGSGRPRHSRSRSRSKDRDPRKGTMGDGGHPTASYLDDLIQPASPGRGASPPSPRREKRSTVPQVERTVKPKAARGNVASKPNSRPSPERSPGDSRPGQSRYRTPSPEKSNELRRRSSVGGKEKPQKRTSVPSREEPSRSRQDLKSAHQRRSRSPSPDAEEMLERYHDVYPDDNEAARSPSPEERSNHRRGSLRFSRKERSPSPSELRREYRSPKTSSQNGPSALLSDAPKSDYYSPKTAVQLRERRDDQNGDRKVKRKSLSLAGMTNPERSTTEDEGDRLRRLIMSTEALERRFFSP